MTKPLAPAFSVLRHLPLPVSFAVVTALFALPHLTDSLLSAPRVSLALTVVSMLLAIYLMAGISSG